MPLVSVYTPSHQPRFLDDCLDSLLAQTHTDWEWVVLLNAGAHWRPLVHDERIRVLSDDDLTGIGALKQRAVTETRGNILVELDHDDLLTPHALTRIVDAFEANPDAGLIYSHTAQILTDKTPDPSTFDQSNGWQYRPVTIDGTVHTHAVAMAPTPHNVALIWFAPNHLRAFTRTAYDKAGGYDPTRHVLDDQDLMCKLYTVGDFHLIDEVLYLQRMHTTNTQSDAATNAHIQTETITLYDQHIESNALAWAHRQGLLALDLGAAHNRPPGYLGVDQHPGHGVEIVATLPDPLPLPDSSVGVIRAYDFLEHVADKVAVINELHRLLAPGGMLLTMTPSTDGRGAFQDPTHVAFYNENSFWYYTEAAYAAYVPEITARFQTSRLLTHFPSEWHQAHDISYVTANLIALKGDDQPRNGGPIHW